MRYVKYTQFSLVANGTFIRIMFSRSTSFIDAISLKKLRFTWYVFLIEVVISLPTTKLFE